MNYFIGIAASIAIIAIPHHGDNGNTLGAAYIQHLPD
jgi:hypothetical protein